MSERLVRGAGVLCHISSLPNKYGIGSLGKEVGKNAREILADFAAYANWFR